jgi:thiol-disulfide isomerase/thioredoxin
VSGASNAPRRPTWRELSRAQPDVPIDESIRRASHQPGSSDRGVVTLTSANKRETKPGLARLFGGSRPPVDPAVQQTVCRFDPTERRLVDFELPGLDGKMVSLRDIDANVILLDFWGSWCAPCRKSIPHLAAIQEKMGPKGLQVVGVACEKGPSLAERQASAAKAVKELGISYPVLISSKDGSCPVQQALQILFYPTMVLIDREGRLLAREQGATDATLARMDRAIAAALRGPTVRGGEGDQVTR